MQSSGWWRCSISRGFLRHDRGLAAASIHREVAPDHLLGPLAVHLEVIGACNLTRKHCWTAEYLERKLMGLCKAHISNLIICVDAERDARKGTSLLTRGWSGSSARSTQEPSWQRSATALLEGAGRANRAAPGRGGAALTAQVRNAYSSEGTNRVTRYSVIHGDGADGAADSYSTTSVPLAGVRCLVRAGRVRPPAPDRDFGPHGVRSCGDDVWAARRSRTPRGARVSRHPICRAADRRPALEGAPVGRSLEHSA